MVFMKIRIKFENPELVSLEVTLRCPYCTYMSLRLESQPQLRCLGAYSGMPYLRLCQHALGTVRISTLAHERRMRYGGYHA